MKKATFRTVLVGCALAVIVPCGSARGAPVDQTLTLRPGWNAVFLEVEPPNPDPAVVFAGVVGLESVWAWNRRTSPVEYIQNPGLPVEPPPYMLAYVPGNPLITNLHAIHGETAYLIKIAAGAPASQSKTETGEPAIPKAAWQPNSFNFVGFHLDPTIPAGSMPTYFDFFSGSPAHYLTPASAPAGPEVYVLDNPTGIWRRVVGTDRMAAGEAFWVYCQGSSNFGGPLSVQLGQGTGIDFGAVLDQQVLILRNDDSEGTTPRTATVRALTVNASQPYGIYYGKWIQNPPDSGSSTHTWVKLSPAGLDFDLVVPPGGQGRLRLGAVRAKLPAGEPYETNVEISDGRGARILLPAKIVGVGTAGLWVGSAVVSKVAPKTGETAPVEPVGAPFVFRIILHVSDDVTPQVSLLREVVQLWEAGTWKPDPDNPNHQIVDQPGRFILVANPAAVQDFASGAIPNLRGAALRDGQEVGRRISTAAFAFDTPLYSESGAFSPGPDPPLHFRFTLAPDNPANPFLHRFNKEHVATDSYQVDRELWLQFQVDDPAGGSLAGVPFLAWGSTEVGGVYTETIKLSRAGAVVNPDPVNNPWGLDAPYDVRVAGTFRLRRVSDVGQLRVTPEDPPVQ